MNRSCDVGALAPSGKLLGKQQVRPLALAIRQPVFVYSTLSEVQIVQLHSAFGMFNRRKDDDPLGGLGEARKKLLCQREMPKVVGACG